MNILFINSSLSIRSGVMRYIMNIVDNYKRVDKNVTITILYFKKISPNYKQRLSEKGIKTYYLPLRSFRFRDIFRFIHNLNLFLKINSDYFDVIHSHVPVYNFIVFPIAKKYGYKVRISHSHSVVSSDTKIKEIRNNLFITIGNAFATHFFACSEQAKNSNLGFFKKNKKVEVVPNGIDTDIFCYDESLRVLARKEFKLNDQFVIGHVGRLSPEKNSFFILNVFHEIQKRDYNSHLILVGDGPLKPRLKKKIDELGLRACVTIVPPVERVELIMHAFDVFVLPSFFEGLGLSAVEAQTLGIPTYISSHLPQELDLTDLVYRISLEKEDSYWATQILNMKKHIPNIERSCYHKSIEKKYSSIASTKILLRKIEAII